MHGPKLGAALLAASPASAVKTAASSPQPVACTGVTSQGGFSSASATAPVTLAQIGAAVGFTVSTSMPDTQSALGSAAAEFTATKQTREPLSERQGSCDGCGYSFTTVSGFGASALKGYEYGTDEVVVALQGRVYVEIGPGGLRESRMIRLAELILSKVR